MNSPVHLWMRAETKLGEARVALCPDACGELLNAGFNISIERCDQRAISIEQFAAVGCEIVDTGTWKHAPTSTYILGLKELPTDDAPLTHRHIYFAHAFKNQQGWRQLLQRFVSGTGELLDLEYLVDHNTRRVAAFGYWAGFCGAALALENWCGQQIQSEPALGAITPRASQHEVIDHLRALLQQAMKVTHAAPKVILIGANGRVGSGARKLIEALNLKLTPWDMQETAIGGPFEEIIAHDIFINCVLVQQAMPPFITSQMIDQPERKLSVIADVSCDPFGDYNPIPLYAQCTTFEKPCIRISAGPPPLDLIAIDNLPSMLPVESSEDFSNQLLPALLELASANQPIWQRARDTYSVYCKIMTDSEPQIEEK